MTTSLISLRVRDLLYFLKVAEFAHLRRASESLHVTQPALSKCIDRLEELYGASLFERSGRGIHLTDAGSLLQERSRLLERMLDETQREISSLGKGLAGLVRVGAGTTVAEFILPSAYRKLQQQAPRVVVELQVSVNDVLDDLLRKRLLDIVIGPLAAPDENLMQLPAVEDEVVVVASASHPLAGKRVSLAAMSAYGWALPAQSAATRRWLERVFAEHGLPGPRAAVTASSVNATAKLIAQSDLLSFLSRRRLQGERHRAALVELRNPKTTMRRQFGVIHLKDGYLSPATRRLIELVLEQGATQTGTPR